MFILKMALKHLLSSKKQSALIIIAVALGVMIIVFIPAVNYGFYNELLDKTINTSPHINLVRYENDDSPEKLTVKNNKWDVNIDQSLPKKRRINSYKGIIGSIKDIPGVIGYSPFVINNGSLINGEQNINVEFHGILYPEEQTVVDIDKDLIIGSFDKISPNGIAVSQKIANKLKIALGDNVRLYTGKASKILKIVAIYNSGFYAKDLSTVYISMSTAQQLVGIANQVDGVGIKVVEPWDVENIAHTISFRTGLESKTWKDDNGSLLSEIGSFQWISALINITIMLAVAAGVLGMMIIMVNSKHKQIGMLKALGLTGNGVLKIFVLEGLILAFLGSILGSILATMLIAYYNSHPYEVQEQYGVSDIKAAYDISVYAQAVVLSLLAGFFAAILPAYFASKVDPAEVLKSA